MERKIRVIIGDNNREFCEEVKKQLSENSRIEVAGTAVDGNKLLRLVQEELPDVLILDLIMPNMDGLGVLEYISQNIPVEKRPRCIVVSSISGDKVAQDAINLGADYYMVKPVSMDSLADRVLSFTVKRENKRSVAMEVIVTDIIHEIGIPAHIKGYQYLRKAIMISVRDHHTLGLTLNAVYAEVANTYGTTSSGVERAVRHIIEVAWDRGDPDIFESFFGNTVNPSKGKPTNAEFITLISHKLALEIRDEISFSTAP